MPTSVLKRLFVCSSASGETLVDGLSCDTPCGVEVASAARSCAPAQSTCSRSAGETLDRDRRFCSRASLTASSIDSRRTTGASVCAAAVVAAPHKVAAARTNVTYFFNLRMDWGSNGRDIFVF